jgi:hypothetical protein
MHADKHKSLVTERSSEQSRIGNLQVGLKDIMRKLAENEHSKHLLEMDKRKIEGDIAASRRRIDEINKQISSVPAKKNTVTVSEHAILRYIERVIGLKPDEIVEKLISEKDREAIAKMGDGTFPIQDSHRVKVRNNVIVTVLPIDGNYND